MPAALSLLLAALLSAQGLAPLRKSDLVRLLSGSAMAQEEVAQLVRRNCLTFDPTERDRQDLHRLGAAGVVLAAVDECGRRRIAARATLPRPRPPSPRPAPAPPPAVAAAAQPRARVSAERSGFVAGGGQSGVAGSRLPRALVFEARDTTGAPAAGQAVTFAGINARIGPEAAVTDAAGQARVGVTLGERTGPATAIAAVGEVEKQVAFNVSAGPAAQLVVACGSAEASGGGRLTLRTDTVVVLRVTARDRYGNAAPVVGLRAAVADARVFRVVRIAQDSVAGRVTLKPDHPGTTGLAVIGNGLREYLTVTVPPRTAPGQTNCP